MKKGLFGAFVIVLAAAIVVAYNALFTVHQTQQALLLQFGEPKRVITNPGLNFKIPFIQNVVYIDKRILDLDARAFEAIVAGQKRLVVDAFTRYKITDPLKFYQTVGGNLAIVNQRLATFARGGSPPGARRCQFNRCGARQTPGIDAVDRNSIEY